MREKTNSALVPFRVLHSGDKMPAMGMGTFGSDKYSSAQVAEAVYGAVCSGYRLIDCAAVYQNEKEIGESLSRLFTEGVVARAEIFITSKVWNDRHREVLKSCRKSLEDLQLGYLNLYFIHWPFPNYHAPGCDGDSRNTDSRPFDLNEFMDTWQQCEELVERGLVKHIGMSNMTIAKLEQILPLCKIPPAAVEMELHPGFQQKELFDYVTSRGIVPIGFCPIGSPSRPERDRTETDAADVDLPSVARIAKVHQVHPAVICLKWAVQRGQVPIPFAVKEEQYISNLKSSYEDPLSDAEMEEIAADDQGCRLIKGQVFLWEGAAGWEELWDSSTVSC